MMTGRGTSAAQWQQYHTSHHEHVGLKRSSPLAKVEFDNNFGTHLPPPPARILDFGFGRGWVLSHLSSLGYEDLHGWDISGDCVEFARQNGIPGTLTHVDGVQALVEAEPDQFDCIIAKDLLEHLERDQVVPFAKGIYRVLKPGGVFLARLPNMSHPFSMLLRYDDFTHRLGFTENSLKQVLTLGGFERDLIVLENDTLAGSSLLKSGLVGVFIREKLVGPMVRLLFRMALRSQRKGTPSISTLRVVVAARKTQL